MANILVVDDDEQIRGIVGRLLGGAGHAVVEVASGKDALDAVRAQAFDVLIIDLVMPDQGGIETIMELHRIAPNLPTIVMSGKIPVQTDAVNHLVERYGAKSALSKPFTAEELLTAVNAAV